MHIKDPQILADISRYLSGEETLPEKEKFLTWLNQSDSNKAFFKKIKKTWEDAKEPAISFRKRFTKEYLNDVLIQQTLGNFVGFVVAMGVTNYFSHYVLEKRSFKNLFGLAGRKKVSVNDIPEWMQYGLSIIIGFIVLEYINYALQAKKHTLVWNYIKNIGNSINNKFKSVAKFKIT